MPGEIDHETLLEVCTDLITRKGDELAAELDDYVFSMASPDRVVSRGVDKNPGETSVSLDWNSAAGRIEINVEEADTDIRHTSDDADDTDSVECSLCGTLFDGPDRCPECGFPDGS